MTPYNEITLETFNKENSKEINNLFIQYKYHIIKEMFKKVNMNIYEANEEDFMDMVEKSAKDFGTTSKDILITLDESCNLQARSSVFIDLYKSSLMIHPDNGELMFNIRDTAILANTTEEEVKRRMQSMNPEDFNNSIFNTDELQPTYLN